MKSLLPSDPSRFVKAISASGLTIYDPIEVGDPELWIPAPELEVLLDSAIWGVTLAGLALRTRSKVVKEHVCHALGYPVPSSFRKTKPRFPGQAFDTYSQKSNNLQVWNEELAASRRYVIIRVSDTHVIERIKVVTGDTLALLDTTGTLTQKYQARCICADRNAELISATDTALLQPFVVPAIKLARVAAPINHPAANQLLSIAEVFKRLRSLIGQSFPDAGSVQERNRGAALHKLVCRALGYAGYQDDGRFPDVRHQLLEVKLQTSPTIDLGLVRPDSTEALDVPQIGGRIIRHCDVRYCIVYGRIDGANVVLTHVFLTTGEGFFSRFPQF
ncbi:MAG: hypothetical protein ACLQNE_35505 [Thermoguttaceae bacterium]